MTHVEKIIYYARKFYGLKDEETKGAIQTAWANAAALVISTEVNRLPVSEIDMLIGKKSATSRARKKADLYHGKSKGYSFVFEAVKCGTNNGFMYTIIDLINLSCSIMGADPVERQIAYETIKGEREYETPDNRVLMAVTLYLRKQKFSLEEVKHLLNLPKTINASKFKIENKEQVFKRMDEVMDIMISRMKHANQT